MKFFTGLSLSFFFVSVLSAQADPAIPAMAKVPETTATAKVPAIPKTAPLANSLFARSETAQQPATQEPTPPKGIEIKSATKSGQKVAKKKAAPQTRDEVVDNLRGRIKALEAQKDQDAVNGHIRDSIQRPVNSMSVESKTIYNYVPDAIYLIYGAVNHVIDIQLQPGEKPSGAPVAGDTVRWIVGETVSGSGANAITHILIKPTQAGIETNFLITTDRHAYRLYAKSSDTFFVPTVGWNYPDDSMAAFASIKREQQRLDSQVAGPNLVADNLNFKYRIDPDGDYSWTPVRVFDDGQKTYLQMAPGMRHSEAPAFFVKNEKELNLVNYRVKGDYFVVDRLFEEGELRCGKKDVVTIVKEKSGWSSWFSSGESKKDRENNRRELP
jgi:type IV secretion system protein TrbG